MRTLLKQWKIALSLLAIFVCGQGIGYAFCSAQKRKECRETKAAPVAIEGWQSRSLEKLRRDLSLTEEQCTAVARVLDQTGERIDFEKERATFQAYLQVYKAHADMRPLLDEAQAVKLDKMKAELEAEIKRRFTKLLDGPAIMDLAP